METIHERDQKISGELSKSLRENKSELDQLLKNCDDIVKKEFKGGKEKNIGIYLLYTDGLTKTEMLEESIIRPLLNKSILKCEEAAEFVSKQILEMGDLKETNLYEDVITQILSGNTVIVLDGCRNALIISSRLYPTRGVQTVDQEASVRGPKDSFTESMRFNTALVRRRIRDSRMKVKQMTVGERSKTDIALMYMEDLVKPQLLKEITNRLENVSMDGILDSGMLEQLLSKEWKSTFPSFQRTQRPDKTASGLLEGRIAIVVDNSPEVLLLPVSLRIFFQAGDDYYSKWQIASFARLIRYVAAFLAIGFPAFYVVVAGYHSEVLPVSLVLSIARAREGIPFPVVLEVFIMEMAFEFLREASIRLPNQLGGTIGIVGGLIVGQAAVDAGLVSTIVVIIVAFTAIASFAIPNETISSALRIIKFGMLVLAAVGGLYGWCLGWLVLIIHLCSLESFGEAYVMQEEWEFNDDSEMYKDFICRLPLRLMWKRPFYTRQGARIRKRRAKEQDMKYGKR